MSCVIFFDWFFFEGVIVYFLIWILGDSKGIYGNCNVGDYVGDDFVVVVNNCKCLFYVDNIVWL